MILRIWGAKENTLRELRNFLSGIWGDQCNIFSDQGSTDPPFGPQKCTIKNIYQSNNVSLLFFGLSCISAVFFSGKSRYW